MSSSLAVDVADARFEIWFPSADEVSVWVETDFENGPIQTREVLETAGFAALAAGVIANLPKDGARTLCTRLAEFPPSSSDQDLPTSVGGFHLVLPRHDRGSKGFEGTFTMMGSVLVAKLKPRGFRVFSKDVQSYAQTATIAVFLHLLLGFSPSGRVMLIQTAHTLGLLGHVGAIGMTTHAQVAAVALEQGVEAAEAASGEGTTDDPEADPELAVNP